MKYIIGLNAIGFNTSATLIKNGKILAAVEEERLSREKRTRKFPTLSIKYLLKRYNLKIGDISAICISWNPLINLEKFSPFNSNDLSYIPNVLHAIPGHLQKISKIRKPKSFLVYSSHWETSLSWVSPQISILVSSAGPLVPIFSPVSHAQYTQLLEI